VREAAVVGLGETQARRATPEVSYRELIYDAAVRAYEDAAVSHRQVDAFIASSEDFLEGTSIFDEYVPDQLGAALKPVFTTSADGIFSLVNAVMLIKTGAADLVVVEAHSKASEVVDLVGVEKMGLDPNWVRPLDLNPEFIAGLEARRFLHDRQLTEETLARVSVKNRNNALLNPLAAYGSRLKVEDARAADPVVPPLRRNDIAQPADYACVLVVAERQKALQLAGERAIAITGVGNSSGSPNLDSRRLGECAAATAAVDAALRVAGMGAGDIQFAEVDDTYSHRELMHLEALGLSGDAASELRSGAFGFAGDLPVNVSGGALGFGRLYEAQGLARVGEVVKQLRGEAGRRQVDGKVGIAHAWRGIPTESHAVAILEGGGSE
jgi:acetyl-CoA C-acetyltransferase